MEPRIDIAWQTPLANVPDGALAVSAPSTPGGPLVVDVDQNTVAALRAADGTRAWTSAPVDDDQYMNGNVLAADDRAFYAVHGDTSPERVSTLRAWSLADGRELWRVGGPTGVGVPFYPANLAGLDVGAERVYLPIQRRTTPEDEPPEYERTVSAFDAETGAPVWSAFRPNGSLFVALAGPELGAPGPDGVVLATVNVGTQADPLETLTAYDAATGALVWHSESRRGVITSEPAVVSGAAVTTHGLTRTILARSLATGAVLWEASDERWGGAREWAVGGGRIYVEVGGWLVALDPGTGSILWETSDGENEGGRYGWGGPSGRAVAYFDGVVYVSVGGGIRAFDATSGETLARDREIQGFVWHLVAGDDAVYAETERRVVAIRGVRAADETP